MIGGKVHYEGFSLKYDECMCIEDYCILCSMFISCYIFKYKTCINL